MTLVAKILCSDIKAIDAGRIAAQAGAKLYITEHGQVVVAPQGLPGWQKIAIKIKSPDHATVEALPCAA